MAIQLRWLSCAEVFWLAVKDSPYGDACSHVASGIHAAGEALVIRNVVVGRLRPAEDPAQQAADAALLREGLAGIAALRFPGLVAMSVGLDLGLRDGGWSFAITNDWQDADAYRVYDADEEHNRLRREIFAKVCQDIARVQLQVDG